MFLQDIGDYKQEYTSSQPQRIEFRKSLKILKFMAY
jgi:hypothetical protein